MLKNKKIILISLLIVGFLIFLFIKKESPLSEPLLNIVEEKTESQNIKTILQISDKKYESEILGEISVYDFMDSFRQKREIAFTEKNYTGMGKFIESIDGVKRDRNHSWIFYVNNQKAGIGVSKFEIKSGDVVSWKYEENY